VTPSAAVARREALRRVALLLGGAVSAPAVAGVLAGCDRGGAPATRTGAPAGAWAPRVLTGDRAEQVATVAEHIIPATSTPGARDARVHEFVDVMLAEYYPADERARFLAGLAAVDARAARAHRRSFIRCTPREQRALLVRLDRQAFAARRPGGDAPRAPNPDERTQPGAGETPLAPEIEADTGAPAAFGEAAVQFFRTVKELTLLGYYTSEAGATRELRYTPVPGRYDGCVRRDAATPAEAV
jgi:hypothetical protein